MTFINIVKSFFSREKLRLEETPGIVEEVSNMVVNEFRQNISTTIDESINDPGFKEKIAQLIPKMDLSNLPRKDGIVTKAEFEKAMTAHKNILLIEIYVMLSDRGESVVKKNFLNQAIN